MDALYIAGLGSLQISLNGRDVEIKRRKAVALLVYLAVERRSQSREFLSGLFWPEYDQSSAYAYLRRTLWEINNVLGDGWLQISRERIGIPSPTNIQTDVNQFQALLQGVKEHDHPIAEPCDQCIERLEAAIHLYRGDFLSGFSLSACPQFDDWAFLEAEVFRRKFKEALQILVNALEGLGRVDEAIAYARQWLAIDNLDESAHRKLMALFAKSGQLHTALRQFECCCDALKNELDLPPEPETLQLYDRLRASRTAMLPGKAPQGQIVITEDRRSSWLEQILSEPVQIANRDNLPLQVTPFVGRVSERMEIAACLHQPDCWLLTLVGMGGIGKTRLAIQVGYEQITAFPHGVHFVSLEGLESLSGLVPEIAETLGLSFHPQGGSQLEQLKSFLRDKQLLLILDNFDSFTTGATILHHLHLEAPGIVFLVTSRVRLQITGEWVFDLQGMACPDAESQQLEQILGFDAVDLFIQSARRNQKDFQISEDQIGEVVEITHLLEGMPLGLVIAASWVRVLSPGEIATEIRQNLDFLRTEFQDIPTRQQSIRAVLEYSWKRLSPDQQRALADLSIFRGGFTRDAAVKITQISLADLKSIMDQSLIQRRGTGRFHFHELMRQFAEGQLHQNQIVVQSASNRHAVYFCAALQQWEKGLKGPEQVEILPWMRDEIENIQAAWIWVTGHKQIQGMDRALEGMCYFYLRNYRNREGMEACQLGLSALECTNEETENFLRARLLAWSGIFSLNLDDHEKAGECLDSAISLLPGLKAAGREFDSLRARLFQTKAIRENYIGNRASAIEFYDRAWEIYYRLEDLSTFSYLMLRSIDTGGVTSEKNFQFLSEGIKFKRKAGDLFNTAYMLYIYCLVVAYHFGQLDEAQALSQESCAIFERLGDPLSKEMTLAAVDPILGINGKFDQQLNLRKKKLAYARERGDQQIVGIYLAEVGESLGHLGRYTEAEKRFREALIHLEKGTAYQLALRQCGLAEVLLVQGQVDEARLLFQQSVRGMKIGEPWGLGRALAGLSVATFKMGDCENASEIIGQALQHHHDGHTHYFAHFSLGAYACLLSQQGDTLTAIEIYSMLSRQKFVRDSHWFNDLYRKSIYAEATKDNKDKIKYAESISKEMDLWKILEEIVQQLKM